MTDAVYYLRLKNPPSTESVALWTLLLSTLIEAGANEYSIDGTLINPDLSGRARQAYENLFERQPRWIASRFGPKMSAPLSVDRTADLAELAPYVQSINVFQDSMSRGGIYDAGTVATAIISDCHGGRLNEKLASFVNDDLVTIEVES